VDAHTVGTSARLCVYHRLLGPFLPALVDVRRYTVLIDLTDALHDLIGQRREARGRGV
jgi:hypothetical protein